MIVKKNIRVLYMVIKSIHFIQKNKYAASRGYLQQPLLSGTLQ